jgi:hypothetical protein
MGARCLKHKQRRLMPAHRARELHLASRKILFEPREPGLLLPISSRMSMPIAGSRPALAVAVFNDLYPTIYRNAAWRRLGP